MASATSLEASVEATLVTLRAQAPEWRAQPFTIFRVPADVRKSNPTAYEPRMVSIGPYYHGDYGLRAMEDHKWRYLHDLLLRNTAVSSSLLIQEMRSQESRARACYSERPALGSDEFVRMLLLDASFILEFFSKWHDMATDPLQAAASWGSDKLCDACWGRTLMTSDLLLLENQIPFFVVEKLYSVMFAGVQGCNRENLFNIFLEYMINQEDLIAIPSVSFDVHHLLHLLYESIVPKRSSPGSSSQVRVIPCATLHLLYQRLVPRRSSPWSTPEVRVIPRATEMSAAGVTFRRRRSKAQEPEPDMYDVVFDDRRGVMEIPAMVIDDMKRPLLTNLIAFEQSQGGEESSVVTSYVNLMSMLIRTAEDVALLRRCDILENLLADDEAAAQFFSHLGHGSAINYKCHIFSVLYRDVVRYCGSWRHRNMAALRRDYFASPWSVISFFVAAFVVALTATQTYFTVFPSS